MDGCVTGLVMAVAGWACHVSQTDSQGRPGVMTELHWLWIDRIKLIAATIAAVFSVASWLKSRRLVASSRRDEEKRMAPITIRLINEKRKFDLPYRPRRDQLSRQELTGLLSFYFGESRFDPVIVRGVLESGSLNGVLAGNGSNVDKESINLLAVEVDAKFFDQVVRRSELTKNQPSDGNSTNESIGRIWNLTPHAMHYDDGKLCRSFESDGSLRLEQQSVRTESIDGLQVVRTHYGKPTGLPEGVTAGDILIVSTLVGDCWEASKRPPQVKVIVPDTGETCKRDSNGRIVSVSRFILK